MKKSEKQRFDFDLDFFIGFAAGIAANIMAQWIYDKFFVKKEENKQLTGFRK